MSTPPLAHTVRDRLGAAIDYLESRLKTDFDPGEAARRSGYSRSHFQRLFQTVVGWPVAEYVRRRRLSCAAEELAAGRPVLETAMDWGYGSQAAFTHAFSRAHGVSPAAYARGVRAGKPPVEVVLAYEPRLPLEGWPEVASVRVEKPALRLAGRMTRVTTRRFQSLESVPALWADWLSNERWRPLGASAWAPNYGLSRVFASGDMDYVVAVESDLRTLPQGYRAVELPAGPYAVFAAPGEPSATARGLMIAAYASGYLDTPGTQRMSGRWYVEQFCWDPGLPANAMRCELRVPLRR